jgi:hypothetical protein
MDKNQSVRRTLGVLLLGVSLSAAACASTEAEPKASAPVLQTFPDEAFTAEFPSAPTREEEKQTVNGMDLTFISYETEALAVGYVKYPRTIRGSLDGAVKGAADNINGVVHSRTDTTFMGHPATDVVIKAPDAVVHARFIFRSGDRLYTLIGPGEFGATESLPPPEYSRLVETFVLN